LVLELVDVVGSAEAGLAPCLLAERFGEALFELMHAGGESGGALLGVEQVGLQGLDRLVLCPRGMGSPAFSGQLVCDPGICIKLPAVR
ncbi:MAG: hypothetical protein ACRDQ7_02030, partial [Haloechinothrix sp.]